MCSTLTGAPLSVLLIKIYNFVQHINPLKTYPETYSEKRTAWRDRVSEKAKKKKRKTMYILTTYYRNNGVTRAFLRSCSR